MADQKLVICVIDQGVEPDVMDALKELGIEHRTRIGDCMGAGRTGVREGSPIWPGLNTILLLAIDADRVEPLVARLHQVRDSFPITPGMRFIVTDATLL